MNDLDFMRLALRQAEIAFEENEIPVGAVIVCDGEVVAAAHNKRENTGNPLDHAETAAILLAGKKLGRWNLSDCTLYSTLEPCPMCAGAVIQARMGRVVFGATDENGGACGGVCNLFAMKFSHSPKVTSGVLEDECALLLKRFFENKRRR